MQVPKLLKSKQTNKLKYHKSIRTISFGSKYKISGGLYCIIYVKE